MSFRLADLMPACQWNPPASAEEFEVFLKLVGGLPHEDYLSFLQERNGGGGPVGETMYLSLWPVEWVVSRNQTLETEKFAPGLLLFAGDGGGEAYAFDRQAPGWPIVAVPLVGLSRKEMKPVAATFTEFIRKLANDEM